MNKGVGYPCGQALCSLSTHKNHSTLRDWIMLLIYVEFSDTITIMNASVRAIATKMFLIGTGFDELNLEAMVKYVRT